ncbi:hypothetical protein [Nocardia sp. CY41]|uniref:hypothetical protein n=1 Tax=Nocardia sp. CY41 TaxID=2608686 RepID=UPI00135BCED9|nr:hypothetical protein [Nocardia sp. CY41]
MTRDTRRTLAPRLPQSTALIHTIRGLLTDRHPLLDAAGELASLHAARLTREDGALHRIDAHRLRLARAIDDYIDLVTPTAARDARRHCETVGVAVDRLANWCALAYTPGPTGTSEWIHFAETQVLRLADDLDDLLSDLTTGQCTVPTVCGLPCINDASGIQMATRRRPRA